MEETTMADKVTLVLRLDKGATIVKLPHEIEGYVDSLRIMSYAISAAAGDEGGFFQVRFTNCPLPNTVVYGDNLREDCFILPWSNTTAGCDVGTRPQNFASDSGLRWPQLFVVELYNKDGNLFDPTECVLWLELTTRGLQSFSQR